MRSARILKHKKDDIRLVVNRLGIHEQLNWEVANMPISRCFDSIALRSSIPGLVACILSLTVSAHSQTYQSPTFVGEDLNQVSLRHIVALDDGALVVSGYAKKSNKAELIVLKLGKEGDTIWQTGIGNGDWSSIASLGNEIMTAKLEGRALAVRQLNGATG